MRRTRQGKGLLAGLLALALCLPGAGGAGTLTVFAAASLRDLLEEAAADWSRATGHDATLSVAGSSVIARQIEAGAPADVVILANADWMDRLAARGRIDPATRFDWLGNALVLIGPAGQAPVALGPDTELAAALDGGRLAMALTAAVPAGIYGRAALDRLGLWASVAPQVVEADNVRAALAWVATGAAALGIVYATDARAEPRVAVLADIPPRTHPPIRYPAAAVTGGQADLAAAFLAYLRGPEARVRATGHGFVWLGG
jgi:molybdate transport system substrate-binding protein